MAIDPELWRTATTATPMLDELYRNGEPSDRKLRLFAVACCRRHWFSLPFASQRSIIVNEQRADRPVPGERLCRAADRAFLAFCASRHVRPLCAAVDLGWDRNNQRASVYSVVRNCGDDVVAACYLRDLINPAPRPKPTWVTPEALALARQAYRSNPYGTSYLSTLSMAKVADAAWRAGCRDHGLLNHLTEDVRLKGCWSLDLVLGKE